MGVSSVAAGATSSTTGVGSSGFSLSFVLRLLRLPLLPLVEVLEPLGAAGADRRSSRESSVSSSLGRLALPLLDWVESGGRAAGWLGRVEGWSDSGDLEVLVDAAGRERRPERRGSLGESGGPIVAA